MEQNGKIHTILVL